MDKVKKLAVFVSLVFFAFLSASWGSSYNSEFPVLKEMPLNVLERFDHGNKPDSEGNVGENRKGWISVSIGRGVLQAIKDSAAVGNSSKVNEYWRALDRDFQMQNADGSFQEVKKHGLSPVTDASLFTSQLLEALLVVRDSGLPGFQKRITALLPKIAKTVSWLSTQEATLRKYDTKASNRMVSDSEVFLLWSYLSGDNQYESLGRRLLDIALANQTPEGYLLENGGPDTSYNAVSVWHLQILSYYSLHNSKIQHAARDAAKWEMSHISSQGEVDTSHNTRVGGEGNETFLGKAKTVDYQAVIKGLYEYGIVNGDSEAIRDAQNVFNFYTH